MPWALPFMLVLAALAAPATSRAAAGRGDLRSDLDRYVQAAARREHFMGAVLVARDGHVILAKGYGLADAKDGVPDTPDTKFRIGSVTKQFTAAAILVLQSRGKLDVDDRVCRYVPRCPRYWQPITLADLLTHTSGIPDYLNSVPPDVARKIMATGVTAAQAIALFENKPLEFTPGTKFSYSNSGYVLLGHVVALVSGESYARFVQRRILEPLGMRDSGFGNAKPGATGFAVGYAPDGSELSSALDFTHALGDGGSMYSSVRDLYAWDRALATHALLPASLQDRMFAPHVPVAGRDADAGAARATVHYGFGWFVQHAFGRLEYSHEGTLPGFASLNSWFPDQHVAIIVLANRGSGNVSGIGNGLAAIEFGDGQASPR